MKSVFSSLAIAALAMATTAHADWNLERWMGISGGSISSLEAARDYPANPGMATRVEGPLTTVGSSWGSYYGSRARAFLQVPATGDYHIWASGDDHTEVRLSTDDDAGNAVTIIDLRKWTHFQTFDTYAEQKSAAIHLVAGRRYYLELLHKEHGGGDHFSLGWSRPGDAAPILIPAGALTAVDPSMPVMTGLQVNAGSDFEIFQPRDEVELQAQVIDVEHGSRNVSHLWSQVSGPATVHFANPADATPEIKLPAAGEYVFRLTGTRRDVTLADDVTVTVHPALHPRAGEAQLALWMRMSKGTLAELEGLPNFPETPDIVVPAPHLGGFVNFADRYGSRLRGLLLPPDDGKYRFFLSANSQASLRLSDSASADGLVEIAAVSSDVSRFAFFENESQQSDWISLEMGKPVAIELVHTEQWGSDHHDVFWQRQGSDEVTQIGPEFLAPAGPTYTGYPMVDARNDTWITAGRDQTIYWPDQTVNLRGYTQRRGGSAILTKGWSVVSGGNVAFDDVTASRPTATFPAPGRYVLEYEANTSERSFADTVVITVAPPLSPAVGQVTREVWFKRFYDDLDELRNDPNFPDRPDIVDALPTFEAPTNWSDGYGMRLSGYLHVPVTGEYRFYAEGDDEVEVWLGTTRQRSGLQMIAQAGGEADGDGVSELISLEAGKSYYIEMLHREKWSADSARLKFTLGDGTTPQLVEGGMMEPVGRPDAFDENIHYYGITGGDRQYWWPHDTVNLRGEVKRRRSSERTATHLWTQTRGPDAAIANPSDLESEVTFSAPGIYTFALTVSDEVATHVSHTTITVNEALADDMGGITRSVWLNFYEQSIDLFIFHDPEFDQPTFRDTLPNARIPDDFTDFYGTELKGYLQVPVTGDYTFYISGSDAAQLRFIDDTGKSNLRIDMRRSTGRDNFTQYDQQRGFPIRLEAGRRYLMQGLHFEHRGSDHFAIGIDGPATNGLEPLSRGFIAPYQMERAHDPEIEIVLGRDRRILWPNDTLGQAALVYDLHDGPAEMSLQWSASDPAVVIDAPTSAFSHFTFPAPGLYTLTMTATDGENTRAVSMTITVEDPLDTTSGRITREIWMNLPGSRISDLTESTAYTGAPNLTTSLPSFDTPLAFSQNYGQRLRGILRVPHAMEGHFFVAADDTAEVRVNMAGSAPDGATLVAETTRGTGRYNFTRFDSQRSEKVTLLPGREYFVEVLHKQSGGTDYCTLAFGDPENGVDPAPLSASWLSPMPGMQAVESVSEELFVDAGESVIRHWPSARVELRGSATDASPGPYPLTHRWSVKALDGPRQWSAQDVIIHDPTALETTVEFPGPGKYTLQLTATDGRQTVTDELVVTLQVPLADDAGSILVEAFDDVSGWSVADLKKSSRYPASPNRRYRLTSLDKPRDEGDQYGLRLRGYILPPATGEYRFNITSDDWSEALLSTDATAENASLLCLSPFAASYYEWDKESDYQLSRPVFLQRGQRYYLEVRFKENGWRDHLSMSWLPPGQRDFEIIDGAYLAPYIVGDGQAPTINISGDPVVALTVDQDFIDPGFTAFDGAGNDLTDRVEVRGEVDTSQAGVYHVSYVVTDDQGTESVVSRRRVEVKVASKGEPTFLPDASAHASPPQVYQTPTSGITDIEAARFLMQASFGPTDQSIRDVQRLGYEGWIDHQFTLAPSLHLDILDHYGNVVGAQSEIVSRSRDILNGSGFEAMPMSMRMGGLDQDDRMHSWWTTAIDAPDQLRQRVAFALSEILVISDYNPLLERYPRGVTNYYDILVDGAFGNYRDLLGDVTLNPMMGFYLTMLRSDKAVPDENYAREVMQLFTIGLEQLNLDGTKKLDSDGNRQPTYEQRHVSELAKAFTGWTFAGSREFHRTWDAIDTINPMMPFEDRHHRGEKHIIGGAVIPAGQTAQQDLEQALDVLYAHPNVAPFLARRLIQRFVTSNPTPAYVYRVSAAFEDNGAGVRGDMTAVVKAILLDPEARNPAASDPIRGGKLREPLVRMAHLLRALKKAPSSDPPVLGRYTIENPYFTIRQAPLWAVSVFNFFEPNYQVPGQLMDAGLFSPEFQIANEVSVVDTSNLFYNGVTRGFRAEHEMTRYEGISTDSLPTDPARVDATLDRLELLLLGREMAPTTRAALRKYCIDYFDESRPGETTHTVLQLLLSLPDFCIEQ